MSTKIVDKTNKAVPEGVLETMKLELDVWRELWDRAGSRGLDIWYELPEAAEEEVEPDRGLTGPVSESDEGG